MNVQQFDTLLARLATGEITSEKLTELKQAADTNQEWKESYDTVQNMLSLLGSQTAQCVTPPADFNATLIKRLDGAVAKKSHKTKSLFAGLSAVAASLILFLFLYHPPQKTVVPQVEPQQKILLSETVTTPGEPVTITVDYIAQQKIEKALVVITLTGDTHFVSSSSEIATKRELRWEGSLAQGSNTIPFTVQAPQKGRATIVTKAFYNGIEHPHLIVLDSDGSQVTVLQYRLSNRDAGNA